MNRILVATYLLIAAGCQGSSTTQQSATTGEPEVVTSFTEVSLDSGTHFEYHNGREQGLYAIVESLGGGCAALDFDRDQVVDIFAPGGGTFHERKRTVGNDSTLLRGRHSMRWYNVEDTAGCAKSTTYSHGCSVGDADGDGFSDLIVTGYDRLQFLRNQGDGTFIEAAAEAQLTDNLWSSSAGWGDLNADGFLDLYVAHYVNWSFENNPECPGGGPDGRDVCPPRAFEALDDVLYLSNGDGSFTNASQQCGLVPGGKGLGVLLADFDHDGDVDIYVANDTTPNFLYQNDGMANFQEIGLASGTSMDDRGTPNGSMGTAIGDFNKDGLPDLWVTNFEMETFGLYRNLGQARFQHISRDSGVNAIGSKYVGFGTVTADFDLDGDLDIAVANGHVVYYPVGNETSQLPVYLENLGSGSFRRIEPGPSDGYFRRPHVARGLITADVDNDGKIDLISSHLDGPGQILRNTTQTKGYSIQLELIGSKSNRDAIGSRVILHTSTGDQVRHREGGGSYLSCSENRLSWGICDNTTCSGLTIIWPNGNSQHFSLSSGKNLSIIALEGAPGLILN